MTSTSDTGDPLATYNELCLAGRAPDLGEFCAHYPEHPSLRERILLLARLQQDLQRLVGVPERGPEPTAVAPAGFTILRLLGAGGMGTVYLAEQHHPRRLCALKLMRHPTPQGRQRFAREADLAARLAHPNVATVYLFGVQDEQAFLATEYVHGFSLRALLQVADVVQPAGGMDWIVEALRHLSEGVRPTARASAPGPVPTMLAMATAIAQALGAAHERGVVHRDVKPSNVVVTFDGTPKLIDFGIAVAEDSPDARFTQAGAFVGSWDYAAPEQLRGEVDAIGPWTDTYALGATLFEMLTLRTPFECATYADRLACADAAVGRGPRFYNPAVPPRVDDLVLQALDRTPSRRFQDGAEFAEALATAARLPRMLPRLARPLAPIAAAVRGRAALLLALAAVVLLGVVLAGERHERQALEAEFARHLRRSGTRVLSAQLAATAPAFERCRRATKPASTRPTPPPSAYPTPFFTAQVIAAHGGVVEVVTQSTAGLDENAETCLVAALKGMELPGVGMTAPLALPLTLRFRHDGPVEHVP